jgi:hypothetical protein
MIASFAQERLTKGLVGAFQQTCRTNCWRTFLKTGRTAHAFAVNALQRIGAHGVKASPGPSGLAISTLRAD